MASDAEFGCEDFEEGGGRADAPFDAVVAAITTDEVKVETRAAGPTTAANALRTQLPDLEMLTDGERHVLDEWLTRITH